MKKLLKTTTRMVIRQATHIARADLRACETDIGIVAGPHHFVDLWARDSLFAVFGLTQKSGYSSFRQTVDTFLRFQRHDGLIPYRVMRSRSTLGKYLGKPTYRTIPEPNFYSHMSLGLVPDGGLMAVIAAAEYVSRSNDRVWAIQAFPSLVRAIDWYHDRFGGKLITEWFQCEWADGILKSGHTLYTNVLYTKALADMAVLSKKVGNAAASKLYTERYTSTKKQWHDAFWNGRYFSDWIDYKRQDYFASHANFLAILFGLTTRKESDLIFSYAAAHSQLGYTVFNTYPAYPIWRIPLIQILGGVPDYHNRGIVWLQPGITYAIALFRSGQKNQAKAYLTHIAAHIVKYNHVYEVYEASTGTPVNRLLYRSEGPFAWSAGLFLWATREIFGNV